MTGQKPAVERTKIISSEQFWNMEERGNFEGFYIEDVSVTYAQKIQNEFEFLTIKTEDNGGGRFLTIETEKFSFTDVDEFTDILKDFSRRACLGVKK